MAGKPQQAQDGEAVADAAFIDGLQRDLGCDGEGFGELGLVGGPGVIGHGRGIDAGNEQMRLLGQPAGRRHEVGGMHEVEWGHAQLLDHFAPGAGLGGFARFDQAGGQLDQHAVMAVQMRRQPELALEHQQVALGIIGHDRGDPANLVDVALEIERAPAGVEGAGMMRQRTIGGRDQVASVAGKTGRAIGGVVSHLSLVATAPCPIAMTVGQARIAGDCRATAPVVFNVIDFGVVG